MTWALWILLDPGDQIFLEDPRLLTLHHMFRGFGANIVHVPVDENGMQMIQRGRFVAEKR